LAALAVRSLAKTFKDRKRSRVALDGVSLDVEPGRTFAIVGPSGAGKSTLLRTIAGLERADSGDVRVGDCSVIGFAPQDRRIAMVFQNDALVPQMTVSENLRFAARGPFMQGRIAETAEALHVEEHMHRRPGELSGGERQRVAIGRALLSDPLVLLLDEPLAHLDPPLRVRIRDEVVHLRARFSGPIVYVTHDHAEAMAVADELAVMIDGRLEQSGDPQSVYDAPRNLRVARFLGAPPMNLLDGVGTMLGFGDVVIGIRPEHVSIGHDGDLRGAIVRRESVGADVFLHVSTDSGPVIARVASEFAARDEGRVGLRLRRDKILRYDRAREDLLT
jgi:ABC-type sugar transport system ATPase subunit